MHAAMHAKCLQKDEKDIIYLKEVDAVSFSGLLRKLDTL